MKNQDYPLYEVDPVNNLKELVNHAAEKYGDKPAFMFERDKETVSISYRQFKNDVDALGTALFDLGIKNAKVAIIGENSYEWILMYLATVNSGNILVPIDKELQTADVKNLLDHSDSEVFVYSNTYIDIAEYLQKSNANIRHYINMNSLYDLIEKGYLLLQSGNNKNRDYIVDNNCLAVLVYTSGTTGNAKGIMLSHKNLACNAVGLCGLVSFPETFLLILPMHHMFALDAGILVIMLQGGTIAINHSLKKLTSDLQKYKPQNIFMVPLFVKTFFEQILSSAGENDKIDLLTKYANEVFGGKLSTVFCAGAPIDLKYVLGYRELGIEFVEGYGLSEAGAVTSNRNRYYRDNSVGRALPNCKIKIFNQDEAGYGEVYVKGDNVMLGYYKNEQASADVFDGEWLRSGDIGRLDDDGFLFISGRKKNLIVLSNGKNVYPEELEFVIQNHILYIREVVVYARNDIIIAEVFWILTIIPIVHPV